MTLDATRRRAIGQILLLAAGFLVLVAISASSVIFVNKAREDSSLVVHTVEVENQINTLLLEIRQRRRKITTLRAFGAAQLQLNERYLVFDFNGVDDPARILPRLVDQIDRTGADYSQHNDARRKQQDLSHRAPALDVRRHNDLAS